MNIVKFSLRSKNKTSRVIVNGIFVQGSNGDCEIVFDDRKGVQFTDEKIKETSEIKDVGNFIAAYMRRIDVYSVFSTVILDESGDTFYILDGKKNNKDEKEMFVLNEGTNAQTLAPKQEVKLRVYDGGEKSFCLSELGLRSVLVPNDLEYTKDKLLNKILAFNACSKEDSREVNQQILLVISDFNKRKEKENVEFIVMQKHFISMKKHRRVTLITQGEDLKKEHFEKGIVIPVCFLSDIKNPV